MVLKICVMAMLVAVSAPAVAAAAPPDAIARSWEARQQMRETRQEARRPPAAKAALAATPDCAQPATSREQKPCAAKPVENGTPPAPKR